MNVTTGAPTLKVHYQDGRIEDYVPGTEAYQQINIPPTHQEMGALYQKIGRLEERIRSINLAPHMRWIA